jgi:hypothetical protein
MVFGQGKGVGIDSWAVPENNCSKRYYSATVIPSDRKERSD